MNKRIARKILKDMSDRYHPHQKAQAAKRRTGGRKRARRQCKPETGDRL